MRAWGVKFDDILPPCLLPSDGIIQDLPLIGLIMQMNHPLWPVVRESARRLVKSENISISAPLKYAALINDLGNYIGDKIPQRTTFPHHIESQSDEIFITDGASEQLRQLAYIGFSEPDLAVCWIEMNTSAGFAALIESCKQLLDAGYPGCVGCDGSINEGRWDEIEFRKQRN